MAEREKLVGKWISWSNTLNLNAQECQEADVLEHFFNVPCAGHLSISLSLLTAKTNAGLGGK